MKKYWIIVDENRKGPFDFKELSLHNIDAKSKIWYSGLSDWTDFDLLPEFDQYQKFLKQETYKPRRYNYVLIIILILFIISLGLIAFFLNSKPKLTEQIANEKAERLFSLMSTESSDFKEIKAIYPTFPEIGSQRVVFREAPEIYSISKNSNGNFEVFAIHNNNHSITIEIARENSEDIIISSKGLSPYYFDDVRNYGIKRGCLIGSENDVKLGEIVKSKNLDYDFKYELSRKIDEYYKNIEIEDYLYQENNFFPTLRGSVSIKNNNPVMVNMLDIDCKIIFKDNNGNTISTEKLYFSSINPYSSKSSMSIFKSIPKSASSYEIDLNVNASDEISELIKKNMIENTLRNCN